ncbi:hypothetical protein RAZWK3B_11747 [Roseobacter sp. AzwK-3b]|nr:hypothetical protein RAZWK3B_11747 [Roseobacter sp. AzwK-3b]
MAMAKMLSVGHFQLRERDNHEQNLAFDRTR